ncbi:hypothetical protein ACH5RR_003481, partial [Cinchona calisaya]
DFSSGIEVTVAIGYGFAILYGISRLTSMEVLDLIEEKLEAEEMSVMMHMMLGWNLVVSKKVSIGITKETKVEPRD